MGLFTKKPFPHTDALLTSMCLGAVKDYAVRMSKSFRPFNVDDCVKSVIEEYKVQYRKARGYSRNAALSYEDAVEMSRIYDRIGPALEEKARSMAMKRAVGIKTRAISKVTAEAAVKAEAAKYGYQCETIPQCYRIKAIFTLPNKYNVMMTILYSDIMAGKLPMAMESFAKLAELLDGKKPYEVTVCRHRIR